MLEISSFYTCARKTQSYEVQFLRYGVWQNFLLFWAIFCPVTQIWSVTEIIVISGNFCSFAPLLTLKIKIWKKCKKALHICIILLHMCTKNQDHMMYSSWDTKCNRQNFLSSWAIFCPLTAGKMKYQKWKKKPGDIIILHKCTKTHDHRLYLYCSWDMAGDGCNFWFSLWVIFCPFTSLTAQKMKISKKWKKTQEISSFYTTVSKIMIIGYTAPEIWHVTHAILIFHFGLFFAFLPP